MVNQELLTQFLGVYAFQPATAFWRAVEVNVLRKYIFTSGTCLDLGCGDGKLTAILFQEAYSNKLMVIGIDSDEDETRRAAQFPFYIRVHTCSASNIPEESDSFDHIISNSVLEHIKEIEAAITEVARLLKVGGTFLFTVPSPDFHTCLRGPISWRASRQIYLEGIDKRLAHYRYWSAEEWQTLLARYNLKIEQQVKYLNCLEVQRWETISRFTAGILYAIAKQTKSPIEIQKRMRLRQTQNQIVLPHWLAYFLAKIISKGMNEEEPYKPEKYGCLLILAKKIG